LHSFPPRRSSDLSRRLSRRTSGGLRVELSACPQIHPAVVGYVRREHDTGSTIRMRPGNTTPMSILARLNPLRVVRAVDIVPHLQDLGEELRDDQNTLWSQLPTMH